MLLVPAHIPEDMSASNITASFNLIQERDTWDSAVEVYMLITHPSLAPCGATSTHPASNVCIPFIVDICQRPGVQAFVCHKLSRALDHP